MFGMSMGDIVGAVQLASNIYETCFAFQHRDGIQSLQQEVMSLKSTLTALQQHIPTDREALLDDISLVEQTVSDCRITMEQMMAILRRHENTRYMRGDYIRIGELRKDLLRCQSKLCLWLGMRRRPYENFEDVSMVEVYTGDDSFASTPYESLMESIPTADSLAPMASLSCEWTLNENMDLDTASLRGTPLPPYARHKQLQTMHRKRSGPSPESSPSRRFCEACRRQQIVSSSTFYRLFRHIKAVFKSLFLLAVSCSTFYNPFRHIIAVLKLLFLLAIPCSLLHYRPGAVVLVRLLLPLLLFTHSSAAMGADYDSVHNSDSWMRALQCRQVDLVSLWTHPFTNSSLLNQAADPTSLLLATFLGTSTVALVAQAGRNDVFKSRIIGFCALVGAIAAAVMEAGLTDFIFGYLFWGCVVGVKASWIAHRVWPAGKAKEERQVEAGQTDLGKGGS